MSDVHPDWINPEGNLVGVDGNAFAVMGYTATMLRMAGNSKEVVDTYMAAATSGDYDNLLSVSMCYCGMVNA